MQILSILMALLAGIALSLQAAINSNLASTLGSKPVLAACVSFGVGFLTLAIFSKFFGELDLGALKNLKLNEWWKLMGGMLGAFMVFSSIFVAPKLGLVLMFLFVIFGQISASLILDYIGAFGLERKEISLSKIIGLIFVGVGVLIYLSKDLRQIF